MQDRHNTCVIRATGLKTDNTKLNWIERLGRTPKEMLCVKSHVALNGTKVQQINSTPYEPSSPRSHNDMIIKEILVLHEYCSIHDAPSGFNHGLVLFEVVLMWV